jgi:predicted ATPase/class 3 adenylate cyclase
MQAEMSAFAALKTSSGRSISIGVKVAAASGPARRFLVGDPDIQVIDVLGGEPLERLASAESCAARGEIVLDASTAAALGPDLELAEWRAAGAAGERFAVLRGLPAAVSPAPWPPLQLEQLAPEKVRPWLLPPVYQRLRSGGGEFLAELRPAVALFLRFGGIDYQDDDAGQKLDHYIRQVQQVVARFDGSLIQLTVGDKGSYLYAAFGAPIAHEDDARRAVSAALELRRLAPVPAWEGRVQIGLSAGRMRTGAYGSRSRRTYGVFGPQTNIAARLMQAAAPGQILASPAVGRATAEAFSWAELPPVRLKGVAEPLPVFSLRQPNAPQAVHLQAPRYSLPMVGRQAELSILEDRLAQAIGGQGQVVTITGEAGMGKSRLLAEAIRLSLERRLEAYAGECYSYGANTSYHLWHNIWRGFFGLDSDASPDAAATALQARLVAVDPQLGERLPLLGPVLNLPLEENDLTRSLDAKRRKSLLEGLLVTCVRARARQAPLLFVLEDYQWVDPLSEELALVIARSIAGLPVLILLARRAFGPGEAGLDQLLALPYSTLIPLAEFGPQEAEQLIHLKLQQRLGVQASIPARLVEEISRRAQGNPFYIEELLNYLRDKGVEPHDVRALDQVELPSSLQSLILTRIDQRTESQKITIKVASVVGRLFQAAWLWGAYPQIGDPDAVRQDLEVLSQVELTPVETSEPELSYLFKHIVTMEVAYDSLAYATRAALHDQVAQFIERTLPEEVERLVDLLAFHYLHSSNHAKQRHYLLRAGQAAQKKYANQAAINYYQSLLPLLDGAERIDVELKLGQVLELVGQWEAARQLYEQGLELGQALGDRQAQARCQTAMGELLRKRGVYQDAAAWLQAARNGFEAVADRAGVGQVLHFAGTLAAQQGAYAEARRYYEDSLAIRRELGDQTNIANLLNNLGILARYERDDSQARRLYLESLAQRRASGDRWGIAVSLNNLGIHAMDQGELIESRAYLEEAVALQRAIGDQYYLANFLNNLGNVARAQGDYAGARRLYRESLERNRELGDGWQTAYVLEDVAGLEALVGQPRRALTLLAAASALRGRINAPLAPHEQSRVDQYLATARQALDPPEWNAAWAAGGALSMDEAADFALQA